MRRSGRYAPAVLTLAGALAVLPSAQAADLNGAWASDASVCSKVFVKKDGRVSFAPDAELYGGGFIVEGNRATGTFQKCTIKSMHEEGAEIRMVAACSSGVMVSDVPVTVKLTGDNQLTLNQGGLAGMDMPYVRCRL